MLKSFLAALMLFAAYVDSSFASSIEASANCLARAAWHEARGLSLSEIEDIMHAVMHRTKHPAYPGTPCAVVAQPQYSGLGTKMPRVPARERARFNDIRKLALEVAAGRREDTVDGATHFWTPKLRRKLGFKRPPSWAMELPTTKVTRNFKFHRLPYNHR